MPSENTNSQTLSPEPKTLLDSLKKLIQKGFTRLTVLQVIVVILTFLKETMLTTFFGLASFTDAYVLINNILIFSRSYFEQIGYGAVLPIYAHSSTNLEDSLPENLSLHRKQEEFLSSVFWAAVSITLVFALLLFLQHKTVVWLMAPTWQGLKYQHLLLLCLWLLPGCLLFQIAEMLRTVSVQEKRFYLYQLPRIASLLLFILGFMALYQKFNLIALVIALPVSQFFELLIYVFFLKIHLRFPDKSSSTIQEFFHRLSGVSISWVIFSLTILIDNFFLSFLNTGEPSAFRYAYVSVLIAGSVSVVNLQLQTLGALNTACVAKEKSKLLSVLKKMIRDILVFSAPIIILAVILSPWLIQLVFQRGAFTTKNTLMVSECFQILILLLPHTALWRPISNCFFSLNLMKTLCVIGIVTLLLRIGMEWLFMSLWGVQGIAWSVVINSYITTLWCLIYLWYANYNKQSHSRESA